MNLFSDRFKGGVIVNGVGFAHNGSGNMNFSYNIPSGASERRRYLIFGEYGNAPATAIRLNGQLILLDASSRIGASFNTSYGGASYVHAIQLPLNMFNINTNNFTINYPAAGYPPVPLTSNRFQDFALYTAYNRASGSYINTRIELNEWDFQPNSPTWQINVTAPCQAINNTFPVALGVMGSYWCDCSPDGTVVLLNNSPIGTVGGQMPSFGYCGVSLGAHQYYDLTFTGLNGCNTNQPMTCLDPLSDIAGLLAPSATTFAVNFNTISQPQGQNPGNFSNGQWALFASWHDGGATPYECDAPTITVDNITTTTARINWVFLPPCVGDNNVRYRQVGSPTWITTFCTGVSFLDITGLTALTQYECQIIPVACGVPPAVCAPTDSTVFQTT